MEELIDQYPSAPWDWRALSMNPAVSFAFVRARPVLPWLPAYVSQNANVTEDMVVRHPDYPWDYSGLCRNPSLSFRYLHDLVVKPTVVQHVDWKALSAHPSATMADVLRYPDCNWEDRYLSTNPNLTTNFIINEGASREWFMPAVCANPGVTERDILRKTLKAYDPAFEWNYRNLSTNVNLPIAYVDTQLRKDWNFHAISMRASLLDVASFHRIPWDGHGLSLNPNICFEYIERNPHVKWDRKALLSNPAVPLSVILERQRWFTDNWGENMPPTTYLSANPTVTDKWVGCNRLSVDWKRLSSNCVLSSGGKTTEERQIQTST